MPHSDESAAHEVTTFCRVCEPACGLKAASGQGQPDHAGIRVQQGAGGG
jgi:hypothetical protein